MKSIRLFIIGLFVLSSASAQDLHQEVVTEGGQQFLLGPITKDLLNQPPYSDWYEQNYAAYEPESATTTEIKEMIKKHHVLIFLGTWCGDSKREVPRFLKIMDMADLSEDRLKIIAVDRREPNIKKSPTGEHWGLQIKRVPTFIFLKDGKEVNRIVESPRITLESDILEILKGSDYEPNYLELMRSE